MRLDPFNLPRGTFRGSAKGKLGHPASLTRDDVFGAVREGGYVITPVAGENFTRGTTWVQHDGLARRRHGIRSKDRVPDHLRCWLVYGTIFEGARGQTRGPVTYDAVEVPTLEGVEGAVGDLYRRHLVIDPQDPAQAESWCTAVLAAVGALGNVEEERKVTVAEALVALSNVHDSSGKVNIERASLVIQMVERLLRERRDDIVLKGWRMGKNTQAIAALLNALLKHTRIMGRVAFQSFESDPLTGEPGNIVRQDNAAGFWRGHAAQLTTCQVAPFGSWFFTMSTILQRAAAAMDHGDIPEVRKQMVALQAVCSVVQARAEVERILAPVAEMHSLRKRNGTGDEGPWRAFSTSWAFGESVRVLIKIRELGPKMIPLSKGDTVALVLHRLDDASANLVTDDGLTDAYEGLKFVAGLLERRIRL
ncbi:MAG: hypothetical protein AAB839_01480 [Patescibacteria group bacterium]